MKLSLSRSAAAAGLLAVCLAVPAFAAPHHSFTASSTSTKFAWEGAPQTTRGLPLYVDEREQVPCGTPARPCEDVLFNVLEAGKLLVKVEGVPDAATGTDPDLFVYVSDAQGTKGEFVGKGVASGPDSVTVKAAKAAYYLAQVDYYHAANGGYKGTGTFTPNAAPAAPAAPGTPAAPTTPAAPAQPAAPSQPAKKKKKASCKTKARKVKNAKKRKAALKKCSKKKAKKKK